jgi:GNAT superfamily N-acetyltransferase
MTSVLQMSRDLNFRPVVPTLPQIEIRAYAGEEDMFDWLALRHRAFARQKVGVRQWDTRDFESEFLAKAWWRPERMWFAEHVSEGAGGASETRLVVGTVTLAMRGSGPEARPVVHWLAVLPEWRRRGIGRLLIATLEACAWDEGYRRIWLETHVQWQSAVRLYESLGYHSSEEIGP